MDEKAKVETPILTDIPTNNYICPNGCQGPFITYGVRGTLVWYAGPDGNHYKEGVSCKSCGVHFSKEWVPAKNNGEPWYSFEKGGKRICYHGNPSCCESLYAKEILNGQEK